MAATENQQIAIEDTLSFIEEAKEVLLHSLDEKWSGTVEFSAAQARSILKRAISSLERIL